MSVAKFKPTGQDIIEVIEAVESKQKRADSYVLLELFEYITGFNPKVWYPNIIGYGQYHYVYDSGHEGDATYLGFSARKAKFSLYIEVDFAERDEILSRLGKHTTGTSCVYVNKLADIDLDVLTELLETSFEYTKKRYPLD